jgi:hypothetical protein
MRLSSSWEACRNKVCFTDKLPDGLTGSVMTRCSWSEQHHKMHEALAARLCGGNSRNRTGCDLVISLSAAGHPRAVIVACRMGIKAKLRRHFYNRSFLPALLFCGNSAVAR